MSTELKELTPEEKKEVHTSVGTYVNTALYSPDVDKVFKIAQENKVAYLQVTKDDWKKERVLSGNQKIQYIPVRKLERLLNFLFNFGWTSELIKQEYEESTNAKNKVVYNAFVIMKFKATFLGSEIERTVSGSFQMYQNPATSKYAVIQAAISQSKRNFAKEFGIGSDLNDEDITAEERVAAIQNEKSAAEIKVSEDFSK
jgi:hypothetical protein